ncbi:hypothetical protein DASC09_035100 [Saccharomycopsis crataegensis]|uniref:Uncharacterized protein n=1 Tax=Saccharomycopsis crataegensis TaxID=43959 RepID=A0AAV5QPD3_9ASCO|nr:hypothetical protein DASC09_035100 [Saccharomycopsis crataegensis]
MTTAKRQKIDGGAAGIPIGVDRFLHHPRSVLSGTTIDGGITDVSLKTDTAVNYVLANEAMLKMFGLLKNKEQQSLNDDDDGKDLIDYNISDSDWKIDGKEYNEVIADLQQEIEQLSSSTNFGTGLFEKKHTGEATDDTTKPPSGQLDLLEEIKNLSKEFTASPEEVQKESSETPEASDELIMTDDIKSHNDKIRASFEKQYGTKVYLVNADDANLFGISKDLPAVTLSGVASEDLKNHLRVVRLGGLRLIDPEVKQ